VAFISVFTLGLVLSVYYAFIPKGGNDKPVNATVTAPTDPTKSYFNDLAKMREDNHSKNLGTYEASLQDSTEQEKAEILQKIEEEQKVMLLENNVDQKVTELGILYVVSLINSDRVTVNYYQGQETEVSEKDIMYTVMKEVNGQIFNVELVAR